MELDLEILLIAQGDMYKGNTIYTPRWDIPVMCEYGFYNTFVDVTGVFGGIKIFRQNFRE